MAGAVREAATSGLMSAPSGAGDRALRPTSFAEYLGQPAASEQLELFVTAARNRGEPLDHTLLYGPPGLGKTTLARIIAESLGAGFQQTSGPVLERPGDLAALLTQIGEGEVLFIDEIHRLAPTVEEVLYPAMEDGRIDILIGEGESARSVTLPLAPFTLVGATTRAGLLTAPLRDRFGITQRLEYYGVEDLATIVSRSADLLGIETSVGGAWAIARRARGTPRIANRLLRRVRDFADVKGNGRITEALAADAMDLLAVDAEGLDGQDRRYLLAILEKFDGGPVGIESIGAAIGEAAGTLEEVLEPYLIQRGFVHRTPRGRVATRHAYAYFRLDPPPAAVAMGATRPR